MSCKDFGTGGPDVEMFGGRLDGVNAVRVGPPQSEWEDVLD
jgi:hypothetical protein